MNVKQLQYAILLSQVRSFSHAAEQLNMSQPALSKQIMSLEQELGVRLFDRGTVPLSLTPAGEYFIQEAQELVYREDQLKRSLEGFASGERGRLTIGISPFRSLYLIPHVVKRLKERFPGLQVILKELGTAQLHKGAAEGQFDFAVMNLPVDESVLEVTLLQPEEIVLAVPDGMKDIVPAEKPDGEHPFPVVDLGACADLPFVVLTKQQELRKLFDKLCASAEFHPVIDAEVVGITTAWAFARAGVGATILPLHFVQNEHFDDGISFFTLKHSLPVRQPAIVMRRGQYVSEYARYAIDLLTEQK